MTLLNQIAVIAGGAGNVGKGIVRAFLEEGATVVVPSRNAEKLEILRARLGSLVTERFVPLVGQVDQFESAARVRDEVLDRFGQINAVVASLGGWNQVGPLTDIPKESWDRVLQSNLTSHFVVARTFIPVLMRQEISSYTLLGGTSSETVFPGAGPNSITGVARLMMARVLAQETRGSGVRINALVLPGVDTRESNVRGQPGWLTSYDVGEFAAWLASDKGAKMSDRLFRLLEPPRNRDWGLVPASRL